MDDIEFRCPTCSGVLYYYNNTNSLYECCGSESIAGCGWEGPSRECFEPDPLRGVAEIAKKIAVEYMSRLESKVSKCDDVLL